MCFDLGRMTVTNENQSIGTWHIPIGTNLIFSISRISSERLPGRIGMGEALIVLFRPRQDDGAY